MAITVKLHNKLDQFELNIDFTSKYKRIGILGASGCGKSMTLKGIAGVQNIEEGFVQIADKVLFDSKHHINEKPQRRKVGYLFQNYALFPTMTVKENIMAGLHGKRSENEKRADEMIQKFQLTGLEMRFPTELSGGQQQRTALARIMAYQPDVILLDEPFSALDEFLKDRLQQEMLELLADYEGIVILVSHSRDEIYRFSEELLVMQEGKIITQGETKEVFACPETKEAARLTGCKNIAEIQKTKDNYYSIPDWNCTIEVPTHIYKTMDPTAIGYRAHDFVPIWGAEQPNCIAFHIKSMAELPFERKYFLEGKGNVEICWFVQREQWEELETRGLPDYLQIKTEKLLYLK